MTIKKNDPVSKMFWNKNSNWLNKPNPKPENDDHDHHDHDEEDEEGDGKVIALPKTLFLFGEISPVATGNFLAMFTNADSGPGDVTLNICSGGGWVEGGAAMYDLIRSSKNSVTTIANGAVYSSALLPFMAGDVRLMHWNSSLFFHDMSFGMHAGYRSVKVTVNETERLMTTYTELIASRTKKKVKPQQVLDWCHSETYIGAKEALHLGLIHGIIDVNDSKFTKQKVVPNAKKRK